ncbi:MucBP domain-containing protein [Levilactobacillus angrenensis]|uniref:MucBP domain-containing protein n=1 Tax=Levilactobacillus angrenensis TaxID=2486020 RepID=A0ABW1UAU3_9LACO|nr:MucBP domain-containing protein [Levilactobacillus angrenensis]
MKWQAATLLLGLTIGMGQPVSQVITPHQPAVITARAATTDEIQYQGDYGSVHWYLTTAGDLHLGAGTLAETPVNTNNIGQFNTQIALQQETSPTETEIKAAGKLVKRVILDGTVKTVANAGALFSQMPNVQEFVNLNQLNTSAATDMHSMFYQDSAVTSLDVSHFDTSHVTQMFGMFGEASSLANLDVSNFNTDNVDSANTMFAGTKSLNEINFENGTFSKLSSTMYMFGRSGVSVINLRSVASTAKLSADIFNYSNNIQQITFGPQANFASSSNLNAAQEIPGEFTGLWQAVGSGTRQNPLGQEFTTGKAITDLYNGKDNPTGVETYVWQPVNRVIEPIIPPVTPPAVSQAQPVTVRYLDEQGKQLANDQVLTGELGASYQADQLSFAGYRLSKTDGQTSGTFTDQAQTVTFHYQRSLQSGGDAAGIAPMASVVYATKKIGLYAGKNFSKKTVKHWYSKQKRTKRPMFVVTGISESKQGNLRYKVRDVNHQSKTAGKTGYITAKASYVAPVYYAKKQAKIKVLATGLNGYRQKALKTKVKHYRKGQVLKVKKIVAYNKTTRFQLTNGQYVSANKKLVIVP